MPPIERHGAERLGVDRRRFLASGGSALAALLAMACDSRGPRAAQGALDFARQKNETLEAALFRHTSMDTPRSAALDAGNRFPSYFISEEVPEWDTAARGAWTLDVGGMVRRPLRLSIDDLTKLPSITERVDHYCVEGWNAISRRTGVRLSDLARLVQPLAGADFVDFSSFDAGYHESWDVDSALHPQTLVVYAQDGRPLSPAFGAPARVFSPVKLGYKNTKYLTRVTFMPARNGGYWSDKGYEWYGGT